MPPVLRIDIASPVPAYRQIANALRALLVAGEFRAGEQLPTVRELALDLGVHHNTVAEAYRILGDEGWLDLRRRRGVTVLERVAPRASARAHAEFRQHLAELVAEARANGVSEADVTADLRHMLAALAKEKR